MMFNGLPRRPVPLLVSEAIHTQTDHFGERLESLFTMLVDEVNASNSSTVKFASNHPVIKQIEAIIFERIKLKVDIITDEHLAAILPFYSAKHHIFIPDFLQGHLSIREQTKLIKNFDNRQGTVNLEKAEVGGIYSEYEHPLYLNINNLVKSCKFNGGQIAAICLHELGHAFKACYFADRTDRTNQVLASIVRHLAGSESGDINYIYKELSQVTPSVTKEAVDKMLNGPRVVAGAIWFKTVVEVIKSQLSDDTYNKTAFEQQADSFASRFGYGKQLLLALERLHKYDPAKNRAMMVLVQMVAISSTVSMASLVFGLLATGSIGMALLFIAYELLLLTFSREDVKDYTYDRLKYRYLRLRQDAVDQLKNTKLKRETVQGLLDTIYTLDDAVKSTSDLRAFPEYLANFLFRGARDAVKSISDQQLLEAVASNDLFVSAAELRHA